MTIQDEIFEGDEHICLRLTNLTEPCPGSVIVGAGTEVVIAEDESKFDIYVYVYIRIYIYIYIYICRYVFINNAGREAFRLTVL